MARTKRSAKLDSRSARLKLKAGIRHQEPQEPGEYLTYRRPSSGKSGTWSARRYDPVTKASPLARIGTADDYQDADGVNFLTYKQALAEARKWFDGHFEAATGEKLKAGPFTVADSVAAYLKHLEGEGRNTVHRMRVTADKSIIPVLGAVEVSRLTRKQITEWRNDLANSPKSTRQKEKPEPVKRRKFKKPRPEKKVKEAPKPPSSDDEKRARQATANRVMTILKASLNYAKAFGLVRCSDEPWRLAKKFKDVSVAREIYLQENEQQRLVNAIKAPDFKRLVSGALATGARYGELAAMVVGDFDPKSKTVLIRKGKNGKPRRVPLMPWGVDFFTRITAGRQGSETMFQRDAVERRKLKSGEDPCAWRTSEQSRYMTAACKEAGLPRMGFHQLRHSYASSLVSGKMSLFQVSKITGHSVAILEKHYAHLAPSDLTKSLELSGHLLDLGVPAVENLQIKKEG